ncbi:MAG: sensor histidine kinase [Nitrososphaeraceae archaeon]
MDRPSYRNYTTTAVLLIIGISAVLLGIAFNIYQNSLSNELLNQAATDVRSNAEIEVHTISEILERSVDAVTDNLELIAEAPSIRNNDTSALDLINLGQDISANLTDFYMWLDAEGKIVWISNLNESNYQRYKGTDLSYREYFSVPKETSEAYYSSAIDSNDNISRLYISYPIFNDSNTGSASSSGNAQFVGIVTAGIRIDRLGDFLQSTVPEKYNSSIGFIDKDGTILYTSTNHSLIGLNVLGEEFQSIMPLQVNEFFNRLLRDSLTIPTANVYDVAYQGNTASIAYKPVSLENNSIGTLYITASHNLAENVQKLINQQISFSFVIYIVIAAIALGFAFVVLTSNRRLHTALESKTYELRKTIDKLRASNDILTSTDRSLKDKQAQLTTINKELLEAYEQLKVHERMQQDFINIAAHELRTPTQSIVGYTELLQHDYNLNKQNPIDSDPSTQDSLEALRRNAIRLKNLTNDILDVSRIEAGTLRLNKERINLNEKIRNVVKDISNTNLQVAEKGLTIQFLNDKENVVIEYYVNADKSRLFQVLSNLINNAIKFTGINGVISITLDKTEYSMSGDSNTVKENEYAFVRVKDNGSGIDPEIQSRLFSKFATKSDIGTGLGLFIAKSIIEAHGGKIFAENNSDGRGATFTFSLPID